MKGERVHFDRIASDVFALFKDDLYTGLRVGLVDIFVECHVDSVLWGGDLPPPDWITVFADYLISVSVT